MENLFLSIIIGLSLIGCTSDEPPLTLPSSPTGLTATARNNNIIDLAWADQATNESGYKIERKIGGGAFLEIASTITNLSSYADTSVAENTTYTYRVRAFNIMGNSNQYSNEATVTTGTLNNGLVAFYPFTGNAVDSTGNGHTGIVSGASLTTDRRGISASAYEFDGVSSTIQAPLDLSTYSVSLWYYPQTPTGLFSTLYSYNSGYTELTQNSDVYSRLQYPSPPSLSGITNYNTPSSQWHHLVVTANTSAKQLDIFINGYNHFQGINALDGTFHPTWQNDTIYFGGKALNSTNFFQGKIDDIRIYNRALTTTEIQYLATH